MNRNPKPTVEGSLKQTPLPHLLLYVAERKQSGTFHVRWGSRAREDAAWIYLESGEIRRACGPQLEQDLAVALSPLCAHDSGTYAFYQTVDLVSGRPNQMEGRLDARALLTRALRLGAREDVLDSTFAAIGEHRVQVRAGVDLTPYGFNSIELAFVRRLARNPQHVRALQSGSALPLSMARRIVYLLRATRALALLPAGRRVDSGTVSVPAAPAVRAMPGLGEAPVASGSNGLDLPRAPAHLSEPLRARWSAVVSRSQGIRNENYFQMLGLERGAATADVQRAFAEAARRWHPDRLPPELAPLSERAREVFGWMAEARNVLGDPGSRLEHLAEVAAGGGSPAARHAISSALDADTAYRKAEVLTRGEQWRDALSLMRQAVSLDGSQPQYLALCAWLTHMSEDPPGQVSVSVERMLADALLQDPQCERAHHYMGAILKRTGRGQQAIEHFRSAFELNPDNVEAARELRMAAMRSEREQAESQPLLQRLLRNSVPWKKTGSN